MLYNSIEQAVYRWSEKSLPVLIRLFGVPVTVRRQVPIEDAPVTGGAGDEPVPVPVAPAEPLPEEPVVAETEVLEPVAETAPPPADTYVPPVPKAPAGFMGDLYGGMLSLSSTTLVAPAPEPEPEPAPAPVTEEAELAMPGPAVQDALEEVYGDMAGPLAVERPSARYKIVTFDTILIPPRRDWETAGTISIGGFEAVEVYARGDLLEGDTLLFKRRDGTQYHYRVGRRLTLGITEDLLVKTYLTPIEAEDFHD